MKTFVKAVKYHLILRSMIGGLLALLSVVIIWNATERYNIAMSPDSTNYLFMAENVANGRGFVGIYGHEMTFWPPLYPTLLAILHVLLEMDILHIGRILNLMIMFCFVLSFFEFIYQNFGFKLAVVGTGYIVFSLPIVMVSTFLWTELLFSFFVFTSLATLNAYFDNGGLRLLMLATVLVSLSLMTRYIGITSIGIMGFVILYRHKNNLRRGILTAITCCGLAVIPVLIWGVRNYHVDKTLFGPRYPSVDSFMTNIDRTSITLIDWFIPIQLSTFESNWPLFFLIVFSICIVLVLYIRNTDNDLADNSKYFLFILFALYTAIYLSFLIWSAMRYSFDPINARLLSPVYAPIVILVIFGVWYIRENSYQRLRPYILSIVYIWLVVQLSLLAYRTMTNLTRHYNQPNSGHYNSAIWRDSPTISALPVVVEQFKTQYHSDTVFIYTDSPAPLALHNLDSVISGEIEIRSLPRKLDPRLRNHTLEITAISEDFMIEPPALLILFGNARHFSGEEFMQILTMSPPEIFEDGEIYWIE